MIGKRLKTIRETLGYSQKRFGEEFGFTQVTVSYWESEEREVPVGLLELLAEKYHINLNWLCTGNGDIFDSGITEKNISLYQLNKDVFEFVGKDEHARLVVGVMKEKAVLKDILYLLLKSYQEEPDKIDEYLPLLLNYFKPKNV